MSTAAMDWIAEFGIDKLQPPDFFSSVDQIDSTLNCPQPHALRRAFDQLGIDAVLCNERTPVIYFRCVSAIDSGEVAAAQRLFWNQGIAPILVLVAPTEVHVYSGLVPPSPEPSAGEQQPGFVETLSRVGEGLKAFILSVESGEYFHAHQSSFDSNQRVDRSLLRNLQATRQSLAGIEAPHVKPFVLDALLCRLVFTCYLFDRKVIDENYLQEVGINGASHLRDILAITPRGTAKQRLYTLFEKLATDFNGDLFSHNLKTESGQIKVDHIQILSQFFHGTDVKSGQKSFWPYDFGIIPIETISAIYEHFLSAAGKERKRDTGAFYTPRFLAEFVLDVALRDQTDLLQKQFLDPACGSGIFLVGLFNRLAEEWKRDNPRARYDRRASGMLGILQNNLYGVDRNRTACQITAFSLCLAFLDQMAPPDIRRLQEKGKVLPRLVAAHDADGEHNTTIRCADFFTDAGTPPAEADLIVGNPPWGSEKKHNAPSVRWCSERGLPHPDRQMASAFVWKSPSHLKAGGRACLVLPHGVLFNHNSTAIAFQRRWFSDQAVASIFNLADLRWFVFEESVHPALVVTFGKGTPKDSRHRIEYLGPKADWLNATAGVIGVFPQDRSQVCVDEVIASLDGDDAPDIWKRRFWASPRDSRFLDRLSTMPRLRDLVRQPGESSKKPWLIAEGFQPFGENDRPESRRTLDLPTNQFIEASHQNIDLYIIPSDCKTLPSTSIETRRIIRDTSIFEAPHVLITKGFSRIAYADFDVSFRHALRGVNGPKKDRSLLMFLAGYLRSDLARYYMFHTSSNWGILRPEVHVRELLRLPFFRPGDVEDSDRRTEIVEEVARLLRSSMSAATGDFVDRKGITLNSSDQIEPLIREYFDLDDVEETLISDTRDVLIPSAQPRRVDSRVQTIRHGNASERAAYLKSLCSALNQWTKNYTVHGKVIANSAAGLGVVILEKAYRSAQPTELKTLDGSVVTVLEKLQSIAAKGRGTFELARGIKVFDGNLLLITKPLGRRFWTRSAAINDADEIAATVLMRPGKRAQ